MAREERVVPRCEDEHPTAPVTCHLLPEHEHEHEATIAIERDGQSVSYVLTWSQLGEHFPAALVALDGDERKWWEVVPSGAQFQRIDSDFATFARLAGRGITLSWVIDLWNDRAYGPTTEANALYMRLRERLGH